MSKKRRPPSAILRINPKLRRTIQFLQERTNGMSISGIAELSMMFLERALRAEEVPSVNKGEGSVPVAAVEEGEQEAVSSTEQEQEQSPRLGDGA